MQAGYLGIGNMGLPMADKVLDAGHELVIYDINEAAMQPLLDRQARRADGPKDMADKCEIVFVSLPTLETLRTVVLGPGGLIEGKAMRLLVNTCTVGVPMVRELEAALTEKGITLLDCPIAGGPEGARNGTLAVMMSGDAAAIERVRPLVSGWGKSIVIAGDKPGVAQILKLTNNILVSVSLLATSEAFVMGAKGGVRPEALLEAVNAGSGRNFATMAIFPKYVFNRKFDLGAQLNILLKDMDLAIKQGEELGVPMWLCQAARLVYMHAVFDGRGTQDMTRLVEVIEEGAGFKLPMIE